MNIFQLIMNRLFDYEYVILKHVNGYSIKRAYIIGDSLYSSLHLKENLVKLDEFGVADGVTYIYTWEPATEKTKRFKSND